MNCSRCGRAPSHGSLFIEVGDHRGTVLVCWPCFMDRAPTAGEEPARRCAKVPPEFLSKLSGGKRDC